MKTNRQASMLSLTAMIILACGMASSAKAQGTTGSNAYGYYGNTYGYRSSVAAYHNPYSHTVGESLRARSSSSSDSRSATMGARNSGSNSGSYRRAASGTTTFRPIGGTIMPQQLAAELTKSPQDRQELEQAFVKCLNYYKEIANANGVVLNDVARASSFYIEANYMVYSGSQGLTPEQGKGLRSSVTAALGEDAKFQAMSAREKQKMYETAAIMGAYVINGHDLAEKKNDRKAAAEFQQLAKENLEKLLGPIDKVSFTDNGIEFK